MKVSAAITAGRVLRPGANYTDDTIMAWLSSLDQDLALQAGDNESSADVSVVTGTSLYSLPNGFTWDNISHMWLDDYRIQKLNGVAYKQAGVSLIGGQLSLYPVPTSDRTLHILQQTVRTAYTDKAANDLFLPAPYDDAYRFYIAGQMYLFDRDQDSYNNMILLFNNKLEGFWQRKTRTGMSEELAVRNIW